MALVGIVAGGIGFPCGQCVQAFHAWNRDLFETGALNSFDSYLRHINWWNMMEITFGAISGFFLAAGLWLNRQLISDAETDDEEVAEISPAWESVLFACHVFLLVSSEFLSMRILSLYQAFGLILCALPLMGVMGGRYWPYLFALPIVAVPIAGKTLRQLSYENSEVETLSGWIMFVIVPIAVALTAALWLAHLGKQGQTSRQFARIGLIITTWLYFCLNFAFFRNPWPWAEWTGRTPSGIIFIVCSLSLTLAAVCVRARLRAKAKLT